MFSDGLSLKSTSLMPFIGSPRRIFIIHCAEQLPFGPYAGGIAESACSPKEHELLRGVDGIWSVSQAIKNYAAEHGQLDTTFLLHHPWIYLDRKTHQLPERRHNFDKKYIGMINPSHVKGVKILLEVAKKMPERQFAAWRSWAFDEKIGKEMEKIKNIELRPTQTNMENVWKDIKVLLVPSLWLEAWGIVVIEAQVRGIPVISSDSGAIPESKLGIPHIMHVNSLTGEHDENGKYVIPEQDVEPWVETLNRLMDNKEEYEALSNRCREETVNWIKKLDESGIEHWLARMEKKVK